MIKRFAALLGTLTLLAAGASGVVHAQTAPDTLVKSTVNEVLGVIRGGKDRRALREAVEAKVRPHFDFAAMTRTAVGRHWRDASPTQKQSLENAFRSLLVMTYTQALSQAATASQSVEVRPLAVNPADHDVTVKTVVKNSSGKSLSFDYRLAKAANGWKVYDVLAENQSLVTSNRDSFSEEIRNSGIDGLIRALEAKNKQNEN